MKSDDRDESSSSHSIAGCGRVVPPEQLPNVLYTNRIVTWGTAQLGTQSYLGDSRGAQLVSDESTSRLGRRSGG